MRYAKTNLVLTVMCLTGLAWGVERNVPAEYATIQAAIDSCADLDVVVIAPGEYTGTGNDNLDFKGKAITVQSTNPADPNVVADTIIRVEIIGHAVSFVSGEGPDSVLKGLTLTAAFDLNGGAIYCANGSSPTIENCVVVGNAAAWDGAGLFCADAFSSPIVNNCTFAENYAAGWGGAIFAFEGSPVIRNCLITNNYAMRGGAMYFWNAVAPLVTGCTIADNEAAETASAIYCSGDAGLVIDNCIVWYNVCSYGVTLDTTIHAAGQTPGVVTWLGYSNVQDLATKVTVDSVSIIEFGEGNIDANPGFVRRASIDAAGNVRKADYHLTANSPCIDAGDPGFAAYEGETDMDGEKRVYGVRVDMGADEWFVPIVTADVKIAPKKVYVNLPCWCILAMVRVEHEKYTAANIDKSTILLNDKFKPDCAFYLKKAVVAKFSQADIVALSDKEEGELALKVGGKFTDGVQWEGSDAIELAKFKWPKWCKKLHEIKCLW